MLRINNLTLLRISRASNCIKALTAGRAPPKIRTIHLARKVAKMGAPLKKAMGVVVE